MTALKLLLELEALQGYSNEPGSLMDHVLVGLITESRGWRMYAPRRHILTRIHKCIQIGQTPASRLSRLITL
jgi:hypothetical protein